MSFDELLKQHFEKDLTPTLQTMGGFNLLIASVDHLAQSKYADHYFDLVYSEVDQYPKAVSDFVYRLLKSIQYGPELSAIIDRLGGQTIFPAAEEASLFKHFLSLAGDQNNSVPLRTAALKGAFFYVGTSHARISRLVGEVSNTPVDDSPIYIAHAARVAGLLSSIRDDPAVYEFLSTVRTNSECADQVEMELGMLALQQAIRADCSDEVVRLLGEAQQSFSISAHIREGRHDARVFSAAIGLLLDFYRAKKPDNLNEILNAMHVDAFAFFEYNGVRPGHPMLGAVATQALALAELAERLQQLADRISEDIWLEAAVVIETHLINAFSANRTVFKGENGRGIDCIVRPVVEPKVFGNHHHVAALKVWLQSRSGYLPIELVSELEESLAAYFHRGDGPHPDLAGDNHPLSPALIERVQSIDPAGYDYLRKIIEFSQHEQLNGMSVPIRRALEHVKLKLHDHEDFKVSEVGLAFSSLAYQLLSFLERRLNSSKEQDRSSEYLFKNDSILPVEKDLQQDFLSHAKANRFPIDDEVKGVASGRADLRYRSTPHDLIIEVKRELSDASFDNLIYAYGEQTAIYQATNVKLGFMLVLDLSKDRPNTAHLDTYYEIRRGDLVRDGTDRAVMILKVPGRRGTPSLATKNAKTKGRPKKRD